MNRDKTRQEMYKNNSRSPCWKEKFRKRCLERLKESRLNYLGTRRPLGEVSETDADVNVVELSQSSRGPAQSDGNSLDSAMAIDVIMQEEFDRLKGEVTLAKGTRDLSVTNDRQVGNDSRIIKNCSTGCCLANGSSSIVSSVGKTGDGCGYSDSPSESCSDIVSLDSWYEEIYESLKVELEEMQKEAQRKPQSWQEAGDEHIKQEEELCSALQALQTEEVICPVCEIYNLNEDSSVIACKCGLEIDLEQDCINLKNVKDSLLAGAEEHSQRCESKPSFSLHKKFGISNLLMSCQDCDFLFVIV